MGTFKDISGNRYGKLTVVKRLNEKINRNINEKIRWLCKCDCGNEKISKGDDLKKGKLPNCGCANVISDETHIQRTKERINKYTTIDKQTGCWEWNGFVYSFGYGLTSHKGNKELSHRASWKVFRGEIPKGLYVLHKCDNRFCVNPDHLFLGTAKDNTDDMRKKNRNKDSGVKGIKHGMSKLTDEQVYEIRKKRKAGASLKELAKMYHIYHSTVQKICYRTRWKHLHDPE